MGQAEKESAVQFLMTVIAGRIDEAYDRFVDLKGKHHNVHFASGFSALKKGMEDNHREFPGKTMTIHTVIGEGDLVSVFGHVVMKPREMEFILSHVFRFAQGRIVEMWDCGQQIPEKVINSDGAF
jgi:predicted SnoaL-like aldol condensation-catalyzing enzyme